MDDEKDSWFSAFFCYDFFSGSLQPYRCLRKTGEQPDSVFVQSDGEQDRTGDNIADRAGQSGEQRNMTQDGTG